MISKPALLDGKQVEDILALTPMQEGFLFHYLQDKNKDRSSGRYFEQLCLQVTGRIDPGIFRDAWLSVVETNEVLRTVYRWENVKKPVQIVLKEPRLNLEFFDYSGTASSPGVDEPQISTECLSGEKKLADDILKKDWAGMFDLREPPFRITLNKIAEREYRILVRFHHILCDGWSLGIILREFFAAYDAFYHKKKAVKSRKTPFREFVKWMQAQDRTELERYWREYFKNPGPTQPEPAAAGRKNGRLTDAGHYRLRIHGHLQNSLEEFTGRYKLSLPALFYTAWSLLLYRYNRRPDVIFDTTVSGRNAKIKGIDNMVGLFINTLPLRVRTLPAEKVTRQVEEIDTVLREREEAAFTPLDIIERSATAANDEAKRYSSQKKLRNKTRFSPNSRIERARARSPLVFDSLAVIENYPLDKILFRENAGFRVHSYEIAETTAYDLTVIFFTSGEMNIQFTYNKNLFNSGAFAALPGEFERILAEIAENPHKSIGEIVGGCEDEDSRRLFKTGRDSLLPGSAASRDDSSSSPVRNGEKCPLPGDKVVEKLRKIWAHIFGLEKEQVRIDDDFFAAGGNSLKAGNLIFTVHEAFGVNLPLTEIFALSTFRRLAGYIENALKEAGTGPQPIGHAKGLSKSKKSSQKNKILTLINTGKNAGQNEKVEGVKAGEQDEVDIFSIRPVEKKEYYPLSSGEERLYSIYRLDKGTTHYNDLLAFRLQGPVERENVERALCKLIVRHENLRTSFRVIGDGVVRIIHERVSFAPGYYRAVEADAKTLIEDFTRPFDLGKAPFLRAGLIGLGGQRYLFLIDMHHIITDGLSMEIVIKEFIKIYERKEDGLAPLKLQYKDFSQWQGKLNDAAEMRRQERFWLDAFSGDIPHRDLPCDFLRPSFRSTSGSSYFFEFDRELTRRVKEFTVSSGVTLYMFLLAAYAILLSKHNSMEDIVTGSPISGRDDAALQGVVGLFINMAAMRNRPQSNKTFSRFLKEVEENSLAVFNNRDYPFEKLVAKLNLQGKPDRHPLFDAVFALFAVGDDVSEINCKAPKHKITLEPYRVEAKRIQHDLLLSGLVFTGRIAFTVEYSTALFRLSTIKILAKHFIEIIEQGIADKDMKISDIKLSHELIPARANIIENEDKEKDFRF